MCIINSLTFLRHIINVDTQLVSKMTILCHEIIFISSLESCSNIKLHKHKMYRWILFYIHDALTTDLRKVSLVSVET